jgi:hypothetical protein
MLWGYMWLFLKENSRSFVSSQRGCFLVAFLHTFLESLRFFNMLNLNAIMWFKDYFLGLAVYNRTLRLFYCHLYLMYLFLVWSLSAILLLIFWLKSPEVYLFHMSLFCAHFSYLYLPFMTFWVLYCLGRIRLSEL